MPKTAGSRQGQGEHHFTLKLPQLGVPLRARSPNVRSGAVHPLVHPPQEPSRDRGPGRGSTAPSGCCQAWNLQPVGVLQWSPEGGASCLFLGLVKCCDWRRALITVSVLKSF